MDKNQGYAILKAVMLENGRGFALGEHPTAPSPYVTIKLFHTEIITYNLRLVKCIKNCSCQAFAGKFF